LKIIKTTGDRLQTRAPGAPGALPGRALFTKELEAALLQGRADLAVHSLKDLPADLPPGLRLAAVAGERANARDVLVYRIDNGLVPGMKISEFPPGFTVATGSLRRQSQLLALRPDFLTVPIRGNVPTRLQKLVKHPETDATILAAAGMDRLGIRLARMGLLRGERAPQKLAYHVFEPPFMLPCAGQGAIGLEIRDDDERAAEVCRRLNHYITFQCVTAERSFLQAMGGGCQTPIGAYASVAGVRLHLRAVAHLTQDLQRAEGTGGLSDPVALGREVADQLRRQHPQPRA
jgi:hydroxymethylbilane synthase